MCLNGCSAVMIRAGRNVYKPSTSRVNRSIMWANLREQFFPKKTMEISPCHLWSAGSVTDRNHDARHTFSPAPTNDTGIESHGHGPWPMSSAGPRAHPCQYNFANFAFWSRSRSYYTVRQACHRALSHYRLYLNCPLSLVDIRLDPRGV